jgi:hypothetical protein
MLFFMWFALSICTVLIPFSSARAATQAQIDAARNKGIAWLINHQNGDGSWRTSSGLEVATTAETLQALANAGMKGFPYTAGVSWLSNTKVDSVDSLSRKILALQKAGLNVTSDLDRLISWRNSDTWFPGTWGAYDHFETSFPDTSIALSAIRTAGYTYPNQSTDLMVALCSFLTAQRPSGTDSGSWSYNHLNISTSLPPHPSFVIKGGILPTALNILEIDAIKTTTGLTSRNCDSVNYDLQASIDNGINWLLTKRNSADGGFGSNGTSTVLDTAIIYQVLVALRPNDSATGGALDYLIAQQSADGAWQGNALLTSLVLKTWPPAVLPDTDKDGVPDSVEAILATNPNVADSRWIARGNGQSVSGVTVSIVTADTVLNQSFSYTLPNNGGTGPHTWTIISGTLPSALVLSSSTGVISGIPTTVGSYDFIYQVTDSTSTSSMIPATINVHHLVEQAWSAGTGVSVSGSDWVHGNLAATDLSGNVYITVSSSNGSNDDYLTIKYDPNGNQLWQARYNYIGNDRPVAIAVDASGNVYVTGTSSNGSNDDYATVKYNTDGNPLWGVTGARYDFGGNDKAAGMVLEASGNVYVTGTSSNGQDDDYATMKYNANGVPQWAANQARYNNGWDDRAVGIATDTFGNVYVTGTSAWGYEENSDGYFDDYATMKYDPNGNALWPEAARYENGYRDQAVGIAVDIIGNIFVTGISSNNSGDDDYATVKYDTNGVEQWVARWDSYGSGNDRPAGLVVDNLGNVYVTGTAGATLSGGHVVFIDSVVTVKYDLNGNQIWIQGYKSNIGPDTATSIVIDGNGDIYVTGATCKEIITNGCRTDYFILKYSVGGQRIWIGIYDSGGTTLPIGLAVDSEGNATVVGEVWNGVGSEYTTVKYTVPPAPSNLKVVDHPEDAGGVLDLTWAPYINPKVTQQRIYRTIGASSNDYTLVATLTGNSANSYSDTGLVNGTTYYYVVRFFDGKSESANSNKASGVPQSNNALATPSTLAANATNSTQVSLTWTISSPSGVHHYDIERKLNNGPYTKISTATTTTYTDTTVNGGAAYVYRVRAVDTAGNTSGYSNVNLATTIFFTNDPIVIFSENPTAPTLVKAEHFIQLFNAVNAVRKTAGFGEFSWSTTSQGNPILPPAPQNPIRAQHVIDLRNNLDQALNALGISPPSYTDPGLTIGTTIKRDHIQQLRDAVK